MRDEDVVGLIVVGAFVLAAGIALRPTDQPCRTHRPSSDDGYCPCVLPDGHPGPYRCQHDADVRRRDVTPRVTRAQDQPYAPGGCSRHPDDAPRSARRSSGDQRPRPRPEEHPT